MSEIEKKLGFSIKLLRLDRKLTYKQLVKKLTNHPVSIGYLAAIENYGRIPPRSLLVEIGLRLNHDPNKLIDLARQEKTKEAMERVNARYRDV